MTASTRLPSLSALLATAAMTAAIGAQNPACVPTIAPLIDGNEQLPTAFQSTVFHMQQIVAGSTIAPNLAQITGVAFRADANLAAVGFGALPNLRAEVNDTTVSPFAMASAFAQNLTGATTGVYTGPISLPPHTPPAQGPTPFNVIVPFTQPFTVVTASGRHLLIDLVATDPNVTVTNYTLDAATEGGSIEAVGTSGRLGTGDNLNFIASGASGASSVAPGGTIDFATTTTFRSYPGAVLVGFLPLATPIDLGTIGAPGNTLYVDPIASAPHVWQQTFIGWAAPWSVPIPNQPQLVGASLWAQSALIEPSSNPLGLVASEAEHAVLGPVGVDALQAIVTSDVSATVGSYAFGQGVYGGAVVELSGTFQ